MIIAILILLALAAPPASANTLTWIDNSVMEDGFIVEMMTKGTWAEVGRTAANTTTYSDSNTEGVYRVRAYMKNPEGGADIVSAPSNTGVKLNSPVIQNIK